MATKNQPDSTPETIETGLRDALQRSQSGFSEQVEQLEDKVRKSPTDSVLVAGVIGYFLHILPLGALVGGVLRLIIALIRPAVLVYAASKLYELVKSTSAPSPADRPS